MSFQVHALSYEARQADDRSCWVFVIYDACIMAEIGGLHEGSVIQSLIDLPFNREPHVFTDEIGQTFRLLSDPRFCCVSQSLSLVTAECRRVEHMSLAEYRGVRGVFSEADVVETGDHQLCLCKRVESCVQLCVTKDRSKQVVEKRMNFTCYMGAQKVIMRMLREFFPGLLLR